jgi:hypothetical protein
MACMEIKWNYSRREEEIWEFLFAEMKLKEWKIKKGK